MVFLVIILAFITALIALTYLFPDYFSPAFAHDDVTLDELHPEALLLIRSIHKSADDVQPGAERYPVDCTVFARSILRRRESGLLQVFLHDPKHRSVVEEQARFYDSAAVARGYRSLLLKTGGRWRAQIFRPCRQGGLKMAAWRLILMSSSQTDVAPSRALISALVNNSPAWLVKRP
jgi:hypothetical protein